MVPSSHEVVLESVECTLMCDEASGCCNAGKAPNCLGLCPTPEEQHGYKPGKKSAKIRALGDLSQAC